jgi:glycosyltransferase involved in cell wall biosynthesis
LLYPEAVGGREKYVKSLAEKWSHKHVVGIVYYTRQQAPHILINRGIRIHRVLRMRFRLISQISYIITTLLAALIYKYDILYVNSLFIPEFSGMLARILFRIPYVVAIHNPHELIPKTIPKLSSNFKKIILKNSSIIIAISKELLKIILDLGFTTRSKICHIPPGIEEEYLDFKSKESPEKILKSSIPCIFTSRRLVWEKGIDILLTALKIMVDSNMVFKCVIVGRGREFQSLAQLSKIYGLESKVTFTGLIPDEELKELISKAYCCVIPSRREGTPIALFEYMAMGKPVIATNVGGIRDVLPNRDLIVPPENPDALASAIMKLLKDKSYAKRVGHANKERSKRFIYTRIAGDLLTVFEGILSSHQYRK